MAKKKSSAFGTAWKGGSLKAAVGMFVKKRVGKTWKRFKKDSLGIKPKKAKVKK